MALALVRFACPFENAWGNTTQHLRIINSGDAHDQTTWGYGEPKIALDVLQATGMPRISKVDVAFMLHAPPDDPGCKRDITACMLSLMPIANVADFVFSVNNSDTWRNLVIAIFTRVVEEVFDRAPGEGVVSYPGETSGSRSRPITIYAVAPDQ
ncbi:uncharacterized protein LTR77_002968 [Saxophila tyrrhenica]|uniref:Uncharacterized protein n=1 Tax=Saxophila tyrrhenica TaxID=1690608 RepID=A0AAV9PKJ3_9PEZI|nr:hypothetical protein LTR77_002968 [Saxophila tyrrhenica]